MYRTYGYHGKLKNFIGYLRCLALFPRCFYGLALLSGGVSGFSSCRISAFMSAVSSTTLYSSSELTSVSGSISVLLSARFRLQRRCQSSSTRFPWLERDSSNHSTSGHQFFICYLVHVQPACTRPTCVMYTYIHPPSVLFYGINCIFNNNLPILHGIYIKIKKST